MRKQRRKNNVPDIIFRLAAIFSVETRKHQAMIVLIDYGMGNVRSVAKALQHVGAEVCLTDDPEKVAAAPAVVLPGVGNFGDGMKELRQRGLVDPITGSIAAGKPFLGICLGMQLLMEESEEAPGVPGLGIYQGKVIRFPESDLKVPHMGWNALRLQQENPSFAGVPDNSFFYFVHSYYAEPENSDVIHRPAVSCSIQVDQMQKLAALFLPGQSLDNRISMINRLAVVIPLLQPDTLPATHIYCRKNNHIFFTKFSRILIPFA